MNAKMFKGLLVFMLFSCVDALYAGSFTYEKIADIGSYPQLSGNNVVWQATGGTDSGTDHEIFLYDGITTTQITTNTIDDTFPDISGDNITWYSSSGYRIYYYNGTSTSVLLSANNGYLSMPKISGSNVAWNDHTYYGGKWQLWLSQSGGSPVMIADYTDGGNVNISGNNIAYRNRYGDICLYTSSSNGVIWDSPGGASQTPVISGNNVAFTDSDGDREIFFYNGSTVTQLTHNNYYDGDALAISGDHITWVANSEIFFYDGTAVTQLTNNPVYSDLTINYNTAPKISGDNIVWYGHDGDDYEIYLYDGTEITQLTDNVFNDNSPKIDGNTVVWSTDAGELYYGTYGAGPVVPEPASLVLLCLSVACSVQKIIRA